MNNKIKAVIFDFDGVLFDSEIVWKKALIEANKKFMFNPGKDFASWSCGRDEKSIREYLKSKFPNFSVDDYRDFMINYVREKVKDKKITVKKGALGILKFLNKNNIPIAIATGSDKDRVCDLLNYKNIPLNLFKSIITGDDDIKRKPEPDIYLQTCKNLNVDCSKTIVIEDSPNGIMSAKKAGCITFWVPDVVNVNLEIQKLADFRFKNLIEVKRYIEKYFLD